MKIFKNCDVKTPCRANPRDAGIDFFVPNDYTGATIILPNESVLIPSGIQVCIPVGYMLTAFNKSGIAAKNNLLVGSCVVDESYTGTIHINLHNVGNTRQIITPGQKIAQFILVPVFYDTITETDSVDELYAGVVASGRGTGGFGSSGTN